MSWKWKAYNQVLRKKMKKYDLGSISGSSSVSLAVSSNLYLFSFCQEPEVEYVEGYDGLEEEEDMEDFGGFMKDESLMDDDYDEMDEDNEEIEPLDQHPAKKIRKASVSEARKIEGGDSGKKSKRKGRVIIEVLCLILCN
ncbi:hypothetical protein BHE74_00029763 [Ensete ventricosum]|nr:hypothetical protein GW17_00052579 [Ensete ventricosum]RWW63081.1 hypothetical protein BHE74_00029763 [Ensete ventricosum]RZR88649.1 hypothetical protein BHM03_00016284 [Ensete ventricosum]